MTPKELLSKVRDSIADGFWAGHFVLDRYDITCGVRPDKPGCLLQLMQEQAMSSSPVFIEARHMLYLETGGMLISVWNDQPNRTKAEVLELLDKVLL